MPTTKKQKTKTRKSRDDIENMDIMLGTNHFQIEESELSNSVPRLESPRYNVLVNNESNSHYNSKENEIKGFAGHGDNSGGIESISEFNRLSVELNQRRDGSTYK